MKLLIIGKIPPPIGGVTIHVQRLLDVLDINKIDYNFIILNSLALVKLPFIIKQYNIIHLHSSHIYVQLFISYISKIYKIKSIITFHGDLNRYNSKEKKIVKKIIKLIDFPIVLNENSYTIAKELNSNTKLMSSFIPPIKDRKLDDIITENLKKFKTNYKKIFCTSATGITYDVNNDEIYGVFELIEFFKKHKNIGLVISDSSAQYVNYFNSNNIKLPSNIYFISSPHSMYQVLMYVDGFIRNTSTDGDSIAVKESLYLNKDTFATNVVSRPKGVILYNRKMINVVDFLISNKNICEIKDGSLELMNLYKSINK